jgi:uncharacterized protein
MSSENVVTTKRIYEAFEKRDIPTFFSLLSPDIHIEQVPQVPWGGSFQGIEEAKTFFGSLHEYLDDHIKIEGIVDAVGRVAVVGRAYGTFKKTGKPYDVPIVHLYTFKNGLVSDLDIVLDVPTMLAALAQPA